MATYLGCVWRGSATHVLDQLCLVRCKLLCGLASRNHGVALNSKARALSAVWHEVRIITHLPDLVYGRIHKKRFMLLLHLIEGWRSRTL